MNIKKTMTSLCVFALCGILSSCTIVKIDQDLESQKQSTISSGEKSVDINAYINDKWESIFVPEINERKQNLQAVLSASEQSWDQAGEEFGLKKGQIGAKYNFIVSDSGIIKEVNTESKVGYIVLEVDNLVSSYEIKLSIGPVLKGTAIRDSLESVNFNEFVNQMDYAKLASELNKYCNEKTIGTLDLTALTGKSVEFTGCFTQPENDSAEIDIIPVFLEVK